MTGCANNSHYSDIFIYKYDYGSIRRFKMVKKISISISEQVYNQYVSSITKNRSRYIENLIIEGSNSLTADISVTKKQLQQANNKIRELEDDIQKLKFELNKQKEAKNNKKAERERKIAIIKGIQASGALYND